MKVLLVDDSRFNLITAEKMLRASNMACEIMLCDSGLKALEILKIDMIDIILLDIEMPDFSGIDILKEIRKEKGYDGIQVIMFTSHTDRSVLQESFKLGANDYVTKPIEPVEFIARVSAAIRVRDSDIRLKELLQSLETKNSHLTLLTKELKEMQFHLVNKEKFAAIGELAAGIAHEINNPMGYVSSNLETFRSYTNKLNFIFEKYRELAKHIEAQDKTSSELIMMFKDISALEKSMKVDFIISDIDNLIEDSLDGIGRVSKIVQSIRRFAKTGFEEELVFNNLNEIIEEAMLVLKHEAAGTADIAEEFGKLPDMMCNRSEIGQVIINMIINAIESIKRQNRRDNGKITIKTYFDADNIDIEISDDGAGIETDNLYSIFNPFFTTKDIGQGIGLGLSIAHDIIVNKYKGQILVTSEKDMKTTFIIKLPLA
ncbi:MAG TPA: response regulator [Patescibacteria group bacterium]|nr:response regulator [Patescibacteria group bacterium]